MVQTIGLPTYFPNLSRIGWTCPKCARCYSPDTAMCFHCLPPAAFVPSVTITTTETPAPYDPTKDPYVNPDVTWYPASQTSTVGTVAVAPLTVGEGVAPLTVGHFPSGMNDCVSGNCDPMHNYTCGECREHNKG